MIISDATASPAALGMREQEDGMTTKHEAALRALEEAIANMEGMERAGYVGAAVINLDTAITIRDALTAQGEVWQAGFKAGWDSAIARDEPGKTFAEIDLAPSAPPAHSADMEVR